MFKIRDDPRITRIGRVLRRTSIDEMPQLINVLLGSMSLVGRGPCPARRGRVHIDWQRRRFSVRPGITCLWQISGRSQLSFEQWMQLDMDYIDSRSFMVDLAIPRQDRAHRPQADRRLLRPAPGIRRAASPLKGHCEDSGRSFFLEVRRKPDRFRHPGPPCRKASAAPASPGPTGAGPR